jgi:hypothetical protein
MSDRDFDSLQKLMNQYEREAQKCKSAGASLAGCCMFAAGMEAALLSMAYCCEDEIRETKTYQTHDKDLRKWDLKDLLNLANEMKWWPTTLAIGQAARKSRISSDKALKLADVGYFADWLREVRDLIHPGRNLRLESGVNVTKKFLRFAEEILSVIYDHLGSKMRTLILASPEFQKLEAETRKKRKSAR